MSWIRFTYVFLIVTTISIPLVFSFSKRYYFVDKWKQVFLDSFVVSIPFIIWDIWFEQLDYWGFSNEYIIGIRFLGLPLEEWLFFWVIPSASVFLYYCVSNLGIYTKIPDRLAKILPVFLAIFSIIWILLFPREIYSVIVSIALLLSVVLNIKAAWWSKVVVYLPFIAVGFMYVNGILTMGIPWTSENPVVWYNPSVFSQIRFIQIPLEDFMFGIALLLLNISLFESKQNWKQ